MAKWKKSIVGILLLPVLAGLIFIVWWTFFAIDPYVNITKGAEITISKGEIKKHEAIYPTRLISVNLEKNEACFEVDFPEKGWMTFCGTKMSLSMKLVIILWKLVRKTLKLVFYTPVLNVVGH